MITWGVVSSKHETAIAIFNDNKLIDVVRKRGDHLDEIVLLAQAYAEPDSVYYFEDTAAKKRRQFFNCQFKPIFGNRLSAIPYQVTRVSHHFSHALVAYYTSKCSNADILILDEVGEWEVATMWSATDTTGFNKRWSQNYPHSVGLWVAVMAGRLGLKHHSISKIQKFANAGNPEKYYDIIREDFFKKMPTANDPKVKFKLNLNKGYIDWRQDLNMVTDYADIAAATIRIYNEILESTVGYMAANRTSNNLIFSGACAKNIASYDILSKYYDNVEVCPVPDNVGCAIGAPLSYIHEHIDLSDIKQPFQL